MRILYISLFLLLFNQSLSTLNAENIDNLIFKEKKRTDLEPKNHIQFLKNLLKKNQNFEINNHLIALYYKKHGFKTFFVEKKSIKPLAFNLLNKIENDEVLKPNIKNFFNLDNIHTQIKKVQNNPSLENLINFDFLFVSIYHKYMTLLSKGSIDWEIFKEELEKLKENSNINTNWEKYDARKNIRKLLYKAVKKDDIYSAINEVNYSFPKAKELEKKIKEYEKIAKSGGYIKIPREKRVLKKGQYSSEIQLLRKRLLQSNYIKADNCIKEEEFIFSDETPVKVKIDKNTASININDNLQKNCDKYYDEELYEAIKEFQKDNGLTQDGVIGKKTIKALNIPIEEKIKKMRLNLERMRWMPRNLGEKYIVVNIPAFNMKMYEEDKKILQMRVIVGEKKHPTPIFSHRMSEIILNPYWRIPQSIVKKEVIPNLVKNPNYLKDEDINVHENWDYESIQYDTTGIDWSIFLNNDLIGDDKEAPMRFIQIPGNKNPLGRIKFLFPNKYSVYLHDTPAKYLFSQKNRAFSHGCIRLSKPHELLKAISKEENKIDFENSEKILEGKNRTDIDLERKIPVHIVYLTAWVNDENRVQFRDDIYDYDKIQEKILFDRN
ncbi:L,D-transpeptidase family protein [Halarcobacter anaerophilus]|uniref:L,D-TPase catalytic domain-containing protein n=1 Tax=Halarcobacter anaerophilus TaxID=877500 RepID=A0A4Q0Y339_9BACT|nr:L,D-transpeptidase family protein [Halarcobacter anaerophilus]QDF29276.1 murein L,D-transpeptidase, YcbB/YkuD family [Halarcobacter anaerophilus]RXJ64527.1 hypothetical protein CRV06_00795 [Halarcobacter anaerophilus]